MYDVLPMRYAVRRGECTTRAPYAPSLRLRDAWCEAAVVMCAVVVGDEAIRPKLRQVAEENGGCGSMGAGGMGGFRGSL